MKQRIQTICFAAFLLMAIPMSLLAETRSYTPPPKQGVIFVVVRLKGYSSRDIIRHSTNVNIKWGNYQRSKRYPTMTTTRPIVGVVIRLRHDNNDSVPLTVETNGQIEYIEQTSRSPRQWTDSAYEQTDW